MSKAYRVSQDGSTTLLNRLRARNEEQDLQLLLERNPDLLVGEQIRPDNPCRWLLVARELAVPDPESGSDRWNVDLFFVDQSAIPTFVECKRFADTRSRREVVAQMLDYAANAHSYWTKDHLRSATETTAQRQGSDLEARINDLKPEHDDGIDAFFQKVEDNLREGQVRMVFFLEEAPWQLRSIVDFLNRQMERSEVLLIEARQYEDGASRVVVPVLFGYTEEARRVKRTVSVDKPGRKAWNRDLVLQAASESLGDTESQVFARIMDELEAMGAEIVWGTGVVTGSMSVKWKQVSPKNLLSIYTDGRLYLNTPSLTSGDDIAVRERMVMQIQAHTNLSIHGNYTEKYPVYVWTEWSNSVDGLLAALRATVCT